MKMEEFSKRNNMEVFDKDFIKDIDVKKVSANFQLLTTFDELKTNRIFINLFKNIAEDINIENQIDNCGKEFITNYARDIYLMAKWYELLETQGKTIRQLESGIDKLAYFYVTLLKYVGTYLHDLGSSGDREVFEVWIIKSGVSPTQIKQYWKVLDEFYRFLMMLNVSDLCGIVFGKEDMEDLQRVSQEFKNSIWKKNNEDYSTWRERNILFYM